MQIEQLLEEKKKLSLERDLCAELYNLWITKLHDFQDVPEKYKMYLQLIGNMEPYANTIKEQIREINRQICEIYGVDNIEKTPHAHECVYKYGLEKPN